jgi:hypothetical protein
LSKELDELKEDEIGSPTKQSNLFRLGKTKKRMNRFALIEIDEKPI